MNGAFGSSLILPEQDQRDVFAAAASRLDTLPSYVEKDFWVCLVLDALYNGLPAGRRVSSCQEPNLRPEGLMDTLPTATGCPVLMHGLPMDRQYDVTPDSSGAPHSKSDHQLAALATERGSTRRGPSGDWPQSAPRYRRQRRPAT